MNRGMLPVPPVAVAAPRIALVAPRNMRFTPACATSIDLNIRETALWSRFNDRIVVFAEEVEAPFDDVEVRFWPRGQPKGNLERLLAEERPDLIVAHQHLPTAARLAARFADTPVVLVRHNFQNPPRNLLSGWLKRRLLNSLAAIAFVSEGCREHFRQHWPSIATPVHVIPNGVDSKAWSSAAKEPLVLFCGRMAPEKGVLEAALALERVLAAHPGWRGLFICALSPEHAAYERAVREVLERIGAGAELLTDLPHEEVRAWMARCSIALAPTQGAEPFGRVAIEAMASGAAVVATHAGGFVEVIGEAGVLLPQPDADHLSQAVAALIETPDERARLSRAARARVTAHYDLSCAVAAFDRMAAGLLGREGGMDSSPRLD
ncbi:MAG: glycosyltransferase family 4 protein [Pseudomonadota bacterium]